MLSCEFCKIFENIYFANVCESLPLKNKIFTGVSFRKLLGFYYKRNRQFFYYDGTSSYIPLSSCFWSEKHVQSWQKKMFQECYLGLFIISLENTFEIYDGVCF